MTQPTLADLIDFRLNRRVLIRGERGSAPLLMFIGPRASSAPHWS
jgi:hypothetical protein